MCAHLHRDVQALWTNEHALAWHLGDDFRADPVAWARAQCLAWEELEDQLPNFLEEIPDCPCTLAQARADSGRFHVSPQPHHGQDWGRSVGASCPTRHMAPLQETVQGEEGRSLGGDAGV